MSKILQWGKTPNLIPTTYWDGSSRGAGSLSVQPKQRGAETGTQVLNIRWIARNREEFFKITFEWIIMFGADLRAIATAAVVIDIPNGLADEQSRALASLVADDWLNRNWGFVASGSTDYKKVETPDYGFRGVAPPLMKLTVRGGK